MISRPGVQTNSIYKCFSKPNPHYKIESSLTKYRLKEKAGEP